MRKITFLLVLLCSYNALLAQEQSIPVYPKGVPNSKPTPPNYLETEKDWTIHDVSIPTLTPYLPEKGTATGTAIIICPGGGYSGLAIQTEGRTVAQEFIKHGITVFLLKYRLPSDEIMMDKSIGPLQDAQRAIQIVRGNAAKWNIDPHKIGVIGFSAGGHLAATVTTHYNKPVINNPDNISLRPDFSILVYPVITFLDPFAHKDSRATLIGTNPGQELTDLYSNEKQITNDTPPCFLVHAEDDPLVPVQNSILLYNELVKNKVKAELHIYQAGGHGFNIHNPTTRSSWFNDAIAWLNENGY